MAQFASSFKNEPPILRIEPFKGLNLSVTPTQIDQSQSPDMLNMHTDERGAPNKRTGYERVYVKSLGEGPINGMTTFENANGQIIFLFAHGGKLYKSIGIPTLANNSRKQVWTDDNLTQTWEVDINGS